MDPNIAERLLRETDDFRGAQHLVDVEGMSSPKVCTFLNRLVAGFAQNVNLQVQGKVVAVMRTLLRGGSCLLPMRIW